MAKIDYSKGTLSLGSVVKGHQNIDVTLPDGSKHISVINVVVKMEEQDQEREAALSDLAKLIVFTMNKYDSLYAEARSSSRRMVSLAQGYESMIKDMKEAGIAPESLIPPEAFSTLAEMQKECKEFLEEGRKEFMENLNLPFGKEDSVGDLIKLLRELLK